MPKTATATVTVTVTRQLKASPDRVYRAWTDPADVKRWFKPTRLIMNEQVDGLWHSEVEWEGTRWPHYGRFTRLERPRPRNSLFVIELQGRRRRASSAMLVHERATTSIALIDRALDGVWNVA